MKLKELRFIKNIKNIHKNENRTLDERELFKLHTFFHRREVPL